MWHSINQGMTLNLLQCLCIICGCRTVQQWHQWHCCICSSCHNIISTGSPPVFHECTSYAIAFVEIKRFLHEKSKPQYSLSAPNVCILVQVNKECHCSVHVLGNSVPFPSFEQICMPPSLPFYTLIWGILGLKWLSAVCKSRTWAHQYTGIHGAFQGVHRSWEPGCDKYGVYKWCIVKYQYSTCRGCYHDQCGAHSGSPQL